MRKVWMLMATAVVCVMGCADTEIEELDDLEEIEEPLPDAVTPQATPKMDGASKDAAYFDVEFEA